MRGFSWKSRITECPAEADLITSRPRAVVCPYRVLTAQPTGLNTNQHRARLPYSVPAHIYAVPSGAGILTCFPSPTPLGLGLGID